MAADRIKEIDPTRRRVLRGALAAATVATASPLLPRPLYAAGAQPELASEMSAAIATAGGFTNRGGKKRTDLAFLNKTKAPAILLETCFCDSAADAELYEIGFSRICDAIADVLGGKEATPPIEPPKPEPAEARVDIGVTGNVAIYVNGKLIQ